MFHQGCGGRVLVDVTSSYRMLADVTATIGSNQLSTIEIHVYNVNEVCDKTIYWCLNCDSEVSLDEVGFTCRSCDRELSLSEGRLPSETGGIYCESCFECRCDEEDCRELADLFTSDVQIKLT